MRPRAPSPIDLLIGGSILCLHRWGAEALASEAELVLGAAATEPGVLCLHQLQRAFGPLAATCFAPADLPLDELRADPALAGLLERLASDVAEIEGAALAEAGERAFTCPRVHAR